MENTANREFSEAQVHSCVLLLKDEYKTLKDYKVQSGQSVKSWQDAATLELTSLAAAKQVTESEESESYTDMPLSLSESLKSYKSTVKAFKDGTANRETVNETLQSGILRLQDKKDFSLIQSVLWLMYTSKGWRHDFDVAKKYLEATSPYIVAVQTKDVVNTSDTAQEAIGKAGGAGKPQKELVILLKKKKGFMWRQRPPAYWNSLRSFKKNGANNSKFNDPALASKKAADAIERTLLRSSEASLSASKRIELASDLLASEVETEGLARMLNSIQLNFEAIQSLKTEAHEVLKSHDWLEKSTIKHETDSKTLISVIRQLVSYL